MSTTWNESDPWPRYQPYASDETIGSWRGTEQDSKIKHPPPPPLPPASLPQAGSHPAHPIYTVTPAEAWNRQWPRGTREDIASRIEDAGAWLVILVLVGPLLAFVGAGIWYEPQWLLPILAALGIIFYIVRKKWGSQIRTATMSW